MKIALWCLAFFIVFIFSSVGLLSFYLLPDPNTWLANHKDGLLISVELLTAVGTIAVAIIAIWGEHIRYYIAGPKLRISFPYKEGVISQQRETREMTQGPPTVSNVPYRFYHVIVENSVNWSPASRVQLNLVRMAIKTSSEEGYEEFELHWNLAFKYAFHGIGRNSENPERTVGPKQTVDLLFVRENGEPKLNFLLIPNGFPNTLATNMTYRIAIQAQAENTSSNIIYLKISWNGKWHIGDSEMANNLKITEINNW